MAKYLVTGGAGFIGSNLVESLVKGGDKVVVYDDFSRGQRRNLQDYKQTEVRTVEGDVRDAKSLKKAAKGCDYLLHLAGVPGVARSVADPDATFDVGRRGR